MNEDISKLVELLSNLVPLASRAGEILESRYDDCSDSHLGPNSSGVCEHCYRHYEYRSHVNDGILESRRYLPVTQIPLDAPILEYKEEQDIRNQKFKDTANGLKSIRIKLEKGLIS